MIAKGIIDSTIAFCAHSAGSEKVAGKVRSMGMDPSQSKRGKEPLCLICDMLTGVVYIRGTIIVIDVGLRNA